MNGPGSAEVRVMALSGIVIANGCSDEGGGLKQAPSWSFKPERYSRLYRA